MALVYNVMLNTKQPVSSKVITNNQAFNLPGKRLFKVSCALWEQWNKFVDSGKLFAKGLHMTQKVLFSGMWCLQPCAIKYISQNKPKLFSPQISVNGIKFVRLLLQYLGLITRNLFKECSHIHCWTDSWNIWVLPHAFSGILTVTLGTGLVEFSIDFFFCA